MLIKFYFENYIEIKVPILYTLNSYKIFDLSLNFLDKFELFFSAILKNFRPGF